MQNNKLKPKGDKPLLALAGQYQNGKSTFLNCLLGGYYAVEGNGTVTTKYCAKYRFGDCRMTRIMKLRDENSVVWEAETSFSAEGTLKEYDKDSLLEVSVYSPMLEHIDLLDTPGYGANKQDNTLADMALDTADFVLLIVAKTLNMETDIPFLKNLTAKNRHFSIVLNCNGKMNPASEQAQKICETIAAQIVNAKLDRNYVPLSMDMPVYPVNLLWAQCALGYLPEAENLDKWDDVRHYLRVKDLTPLSLLNSSNFLPMRNMMKDFVSSFFYFTPAGELDLVKSVTDNWTNELKNILEE